MMIQLPAITLFLSTSLFAVIDFQKEVWPILEQSGSVTWHPEKNGITKKPKAGLRLDGAAYIMVVMTVLWLLWITQVKVLFIRELFYPKMLDHMPPKGGSLSKEQKEKYGCGSHRG